MSRLNCPCGKEMSDSSEAEFEQSWGFVVSNKEWFDYQEMVAKMLAGFVEAHKSGQQAEWLSKNCPVHADQPLEGIVSDILSRLDQDMGLSCAVCGDCGGMMVQNEASENSYQAYRPH